MKLLNLILNSDRIFAVILIMLSGLMYVLIGGMADPYSPGDLAASTYPRLVLACIVFLSTILVIRPTRSSEIDSVPLMRGIPVIILMAVYITLLESVGFFVLTPILLFLLPLITGFRRYTAILLSVVVVTAALYGIFIEVLNIPLPGGLFGD